MHRTNSFIHWPMQLDVIRKSLTSKLRDVTITNPNPIKNGSYPGEINRWDYLQGFP